MIVNLRISESVKKKLENDKFIYGCCYMRIKKNGQLKRFLTGAENTASRIPANEVRIGFRPEGKIIYK